MKKLALSLSLALALSSVSTVFAAIPQKVRIGTDPTYAPFESKNAQGELVGFDIDLAKELCKRINTQCTFIENPLDALILFKSEENRRHHVFAFDHRKTPAGNCLHRQTIRG